LSKQFDELAKDLANGVSRRSAIGRFLAGIGAAAGIFFGRKTAQAEPQAQACMDFCRSLYQGEDFGQCIAHSNKCPTGTCAFNLTLNGSVNSTAIVGGSSGGQWVCTCGPSSTVDCIHTAG